MPAVVPTAASQAVGRGTNDLAEWISSARDFELNEDFLLDDSVRGISLDLPHLMAAMKQQSAGKRTIQALADKLILHRLLENLGVPQLPALLAVSGRVSRTAVSNFVEKHLAAKGAPDVVVKPTHLSNGAGVLVLSRVEASQRRETVNFLVEHMRHFMGQHAGQHESLALQSLRPGFLIQPRYQSVVEFKMPMELRVVALWGRVRLGLWWWGRGSGATCEVPQRNAWIIRRPSIPGELSDDDQWEVIHEHVGSNPGFDRALDLFKRHMPAMASTTEAVAKAVGAPFLRADYFVGSVDWGVRLNEVAYGCGVDYRTCLDDGDRRLADDAPNIAQILQEGMAICESVKPASHFLSRLGVLGESYSDLTVGAALPRGGLQLPPNALKAGSDENAMNCVVPESMCKTLRSWRRSVSPDAGKSSAALAELCRGANQHSPPPRILAQRMLPNESSSSRRWAQAHSPPPSILMPRMLPMDVVLPPGLCWRHL